VATGFTVGLKKPSTVQSSFSLDVEAMTLTRNYANTKGQPDRARRCFYRQLLTRGRQTAGRITAAPCSPSLFPRFPSIPSFVNLVVAIKTRHLTGNGKRMCKFSNKRSRTLYSCWQL